MCAFLWLLKHGRVMTYSERRKRGLTTDENCKVCGNPTKDIDHIFWKCTAAKNVWKALVASGDLQKLNDLSWNEWFSANINGRASPRILVRLEFRIFHCCLVGLEMEKRHGVQ